MSQISRSSTTQRKGRKSRADEGSPGRVPNSHEEVSGVGATVSSVEAPTCAKTSRQHKTSRHQQRSEQRRSKPQGIDAEVRAAEEQLAAIDPNVAGIDLGSTSHYVAVPDGPGHVVVREFGCFTPELVAMADWLKERGVHRVVMESTGVYWVPVYQVLEDQGLEATLVDARYAANLPGRKKTDVYDCAWLRKLQTYGLLKACFVPSASVTEMRTYWRHRGTLVEQASRQILLMHKAMEQMNIQLHKAITDTSGVTRMTIIRAIVAGERRPEVLAEMRQPGLKCTPEQLVSALTGNWREEHLFTLKQAIDSYDFFHRQIEECDAHLQAAMARYEPEDLPAAQADTATDILGQTDLPDGDETTRAVSSRRRRRRKDRSKNEPRFDMHSELIRMCGVDLTQIDGIGVSTGMTVLSECGPTLSTFKTEGHLSSYLGLSPNHRVTGGQVKSNRTNKVRSRAAQALRQAAECLQHSDSALGAYYRRMHARLGAPKAITAAAHKLACLIFRMIKYGQEYVDRGQAWYEEQYELKVRQRLTKQARRLGLMLLDPSTGEVVS